MIRVNIPLQELKRPLCLWRNHTNARNPRK